MYDAYKINNPNDFPSLYFISKGDRLQVNTISEKNALKPVQLNISSTQTTTMEIWIEETPEINGCLLLYDNKTSSYYTIEDSAHFTVLVDVNDTIWGNRFEIEVLNAISEKNTINESCFETNDGQVELLFSNFTGSWTIKNQKGDLISTGSNVNPLVENLKADYYTIDWNAANCGTFEDYFFITQPEEIKTKFEIPTSIIIGEEVSPNNITSGASSFKWLVNEVEKSTDPFPSFTFEQEGEFQIALEANEGDCKKTYSQSLKVGPPDSNPTSLKKVSENETQLWTNNSIVFWTGLDNAQSIEVFNTAGQLVKRSTIGKSQKTLELKSLESGAYIVSILDGTGKQLETVKLIK